MKLKITGACLPRWSKVLDFPVRGNVTVYFDFVQLLFCLHSFGAFGIHVVIYSEFPQAPFKCSSEQSFRLSPVSI